MRICYLCADQGVSLAKHQGASTHVRNMVRVFAALGHEVILIMANPEGTDDLGVPIHAIPVPNTIQGVRSARRNPEVPATVAGGRDSARVVYALHSLWNNITLEQALEKLLACQQPDLLYERYSKFSVAGPLAARRFGCRHVLEVNAPLAWQGAQYRDQALTEAAELLEFVAFSTAGMIRVISNELRDDLLNRGIPASKVGVVPCGVDTALFTPEVEAFRDGPEGKFLIGFLGSLKAWHGIEILADAFRLLADEPAFHLLIVGDGPRSDVIDALGRDLPGRVTHYKDVCWSDVPGYIKAMDMSVAPYPDQRFFFSPLKVLESMAVGHPVVASRIGQIELLLRDGKTGLLVQPGDARELAEAARRLFAEPRLGYELGVAAAREVHRSHSWLQRVADIIELAKSQPMSSPDEFSL